MNWKLIGHCSLAIGILFITLFTKIGSFALVEKFPQRIISGIPSITEMLFSIGAGEQVVGVTNNCNYPPEAQKKEKVGGFFLNLEKIVALKPDLVILFEGTQQREIKRFRDFGLPVYTVNPTSLEGVMTTILDLGNITGRQGQAAEVVRVLRQRLGRVKGRSLGLAGVLKFLEQGEKKEKALAIIGYNPLIVAGGGSFVDDLVRQAGLKNLAGDGTVPYPQYSFEKIIQDDPDVLIVSSGLIAKRTLQNDSRWRGINAVKHNQVLFVEADLLSRPGPRAIEAVEQIADFIR
jgi:iron complex transport system substrate-binding protein